MAEISKFDDMIDVRDVIARFEELEADRKPWSAGWNMPGYLPDSEPGRFETFEDAQGYIVAGIKRCEEEAADEAEATTYCHAAEDANLWSEGEQGQTIGQYHFWITPMVGADAFDDADDAEEYEALRVLLDDLRGRGGDEQWQGDWYPITLIRDRYFTEAMRELCEESGDLPNGIPSYLEIDWEATARNLQVDYTSTEFHGITYWYR